MIPVPEYSSSRIIQRPLCHPVIQSRRPQKRSSVCARRAIDTRQAVRAIDENCDGIGGSPQVCVGCSRLAAEPMVNVAVPGGETGSGCVLTRARVEGQ